MSTRRIAALLAPLLLLGCSRKAPGPTECHELALRLTGIPSPAPDLRRLDPRVQRAIDEVTLRCLTTPYDRELVACIQKGSEIRACFAAFQQRHPERVQRALPRAPAE